MLFLSKSFLLSAFRDLYRRKSRSLVVILVMAVTTAFPIAFLSTSASLDKSLEEDAEKSRLCHLDIRFQEAPQGVISLIANSMTADVQFEGRIVILGRSLSQDKWHSTQIMGFDPPNHPTLNQFHLKDGRMIENNQSEALVLESYAQFIHKQIGDNITLQGPNGQREFIIVGLVTSIEFMSFDLGREAGVFVSNDVARELAALSPGTINSVLLYFEKGISKEDLEVEAGKLRRYLAEQGIPAVILWHVREVSIRSSLNRAVGLTSQYLAVSSILTLIVCGIIVFVVMNRYVAEQRKLIGVYGAFGFNKKEILGNYLLRAVILGFLGTILGIVGAGFILQYLVDEIAGGWGVETRKAQFDLPLFFLVLITAWTIILIFAAIPAWKATRLTPYEALRGFDKGKKAQKGLLDVLFFSHKLPSLPRLAIRNTGRNRIRSWLTAFAIIFSLALSASLLASANSVRETVKDFYATHTRWDLQASFFEPGVNESTIALLEQDQRILRLEKEFLFFSQPVEDPTAIVIGRAKELPSVLETFKLDEGESLTNSSAPDCLLSSRVAKDLNLHVGETITLMLSVSNLTLYIRGLITDFDRTISAVLSLDVLREHFAKYPTVYPATSVYNSILIESNEPKAVMQDLLADPAIQQVRSRSEARDQMLRYVDTAVIVAYLMSILGFLVAFVALFNTFFISIVERERELGIMKAFGFSTPELFRGLLYEALILVPIATLIGLIASYPLSLYLIGLVGFYFFPITYFLLLSTIAVSVIFALLATLTAILPGFYIVNKKRLATAIQEE
ncbi:MAG: ABC transporter permease [Candidatus Heimdallarchaeota archaeon]